MSQEALIEKYLLGKLNSEEKELVAQLLKSDPAFKAALKYHGNLQQAIEKEEDTSFKETLQKFEPVSTSQSNRSILKWLIAASILILVAVGTLVVFPTSSTDPLFAKHFEPYANVVEPVVRGASADAIKTKAFVAYEASDYKLAETHFTTLLNSTSDSYVLFYLANTKLSLGQASEAIPLLQSYLTTGDNFSSQAQWYLALSLIQNGDIVEAKNMLQKIVTYEGYNAAKAALILEELK